MNYFRNSVAQNMKQMRFENGEQKKPEWSKSVTNKAHNTKELSKRTAGLPEGKQQRRNFN